MNVVALQQIVSDKSDFGTFGCFFETPVKEMHADMKSTYDSTFKLRRKMRFGRYPLWKPQASSPERRYQCAVARLGAPGV
jgi:hypothetical protein